MKCTEVLKTLKKVIGQSDNFVSLHEPTFSGNEWVYVKDCIDSTYVSSVGSYVDRFEVMLSEYTGVKRAIAVVNGTAALHVCLILAGVKTGDEILLPTLTFVATPNALSYCGAIPHFVDSEEKTLGLDPHKLAGYLSEVAEVRGDECFNRKSGRRIKSVVPMHTYGHPVDLDPLLDVCERFKLVLIEDAAESLGSYYKGKHTGQWGKLSALSFNGNKVITTGGGGAILTNDEELGNLAKHLTTTAKVPHKWEFRHDMVGYNYRLPNLNAALGCAQLEQLPSFLQNKRVLAENYRKAFSDFDGLHFFSEPEQAQSNYWLNALLLDDVNCDKRDELLALTNNSGIMTRPSWTLMHKLPMFKDCPRMNLVVAEALERRLINIPSSSSLGGSHA